MATTKNKINNSEYGQRLREARNVLNLSRAKLAEITTVHPNTLKNWETGETKPDPGSYYENLLRDKAGINPHWLRTGEGEMFVKTFTGSAQVEIGGQIKDEGFIAEARKKSPENESKQAYTTTSKSSDFNDKKFAKSYIDSNRNEGDNLEDGGDLADYRIAGYWNQIKALDVLTLRVTRKGGLIRSEVVVLGKIGIPAVDYNPNLSCYWYKGREMGDIRSGSILIVDESKIEPIPGELYLYKYSSNSANPSHFIYVVRRLKLPQTHGGFDLVNTEGTEKTNIPSFDALVDMTVGRILFVYARMELAGDFVLDKSSLIYEAKNKAPERGPTME